MDDDFYKEWKDVRAFVYGTCPAVQTITNVQCQDEGKIISKQTRASTFVGLVTRGNLFFRTYVDF